MVGSLVEKKVIFCAIEDYIISLTTWVHISFTSVGLVRVLAYTISLAALLLDSNDVIL